MSLHKDIHQNMQRVIQELEARGSYYISPGLVALKVYDLYSGELEEPHISYACYEHYKQMARQLLAEKQPTAYKIAIPSRYRAFQITNRSQSLQNRSCFGTMNGYAKPRTL